MSGSSRKSAEAAKAAKQKKILAVSSVVFLALIGFQLPKLMGGGGSQAAAPPTDTSVVAPTPDGSVAVTPAPVTPAPVGGLPDTDRISIERGSDQLVSFGLFKSKDPFVQQIGANSGVIAPTPIPAPAIPTSTAPLVPATTPTAVQPHVPPRRTAPNGGLTPVTTPAPTLTTPAAGSPSSSPVVPPAVTPVTPPRTTTTPRPTTPAVAPTSVSLSTNGECEVVTPNGTFPNDEDIFRLISIAKDGKSVKIGVVGGAYDSGAAAVTLELGKKLTLVNTADGTRYVLLLQAKCDVTTSPASGAATTTTPTPTVTAPTTSTVTTPIVTDALDTTPVGG